jgi:signal transduction histidine kinase/CheY-like chemotaxis protein
MRVKSLLIALVTGIALPLVALAGFVTWQYWQHQRSAYEQRYLERANAVRLAIDTEFSVVLRTLRVVGDATEIAPPDIESVLLRRFRRVLDNYPHWAAVVLANDRGEVIMSETRPGTAAPPHLDESKILRTLSSDTGFVSDVSTAPDGRHLVFVATAVTQSDRTQGVIYAVIAHTHWLDLLREYPVSERGTLTLIDRNATIITRTRNDEKWSGTRAPAKFWDQTLDRVSGSFEVTGVDGTPLYAAFSRSKASAWVLATGVPQDEVVQALYWQTLMVAGVALVAMLGAMLAAWRLSHSIASAFSGLLASAEALASDAHVPDFVPPIREAQMVQRALSDAQHELAARQLSLNGALEREGVARQQAESSSRSKDKFLAMMGHELRNPLSAISLAAELIPADEPNPVVGRSGEIIKRQARHLTSMVNDLMDVAQLGAGTIVLHRKHLDLASVAAKVLNRFDETGRCAHLKIRIEHAPAYIDADEARLELLITCLLDNACKYTPPGGDVILEVTVDGDVSVLRVRDTGVGIAPDVAASMFEAFTQSERGIERSQGGLGLGLALAGQLVELHGGEISATSNGPGQGSAFTVVFPRVTSPQAVASPPNATVSRDMVFTVVEDIADTRTMLMEFIEGTGRCINGAADGPSGVEAILQGPSDIAIIDIGLPGFSGLEVARRVRAQAQERRIYLIALTGFGTEADRAGALAAGFDEFLVKPFDPDLFEQAIDRALAAVRGTGASGPS